MYRTPLICAAGETATMVGGGAAAAGVIVLGPAELLAAFLGTMFSQPAPVVP